MDGWETLPLFCDPKHPVADQFAEAVCVCVCVVLL